MLKKYRGLIAVFVILILSISIFTIYKITNKGNNVTVFAGSGKMGAVDGNSLEATFNLPYSLALDKDGGILIIDCYNNKIRKVKDGKVTTVAGFTDKKDSYGLPKGGYVDDTVDIAKFNRPRAAVVDSKGNIFVADTGNNVIRKISDGAVYTFAGNVEKGYQDGFGSQAKFNTPSALAVDKNDNIYVADTLNNAIRMITPGGEVSTFAGKANNKDGFQDGTLSEALFNEPSAVALDSNGVVYVLDTGNQLVRKIENDMVLTLAGNNTGSLVTDTNYVQGAFKDGAGNKARFNFPKGFYVTPEGIVFIADTWNQKIRVIDRKGNVDTIAGSGVAGNKIDVRMEAEFNGPNAVLYDNGVLYICDMRNNCIKEFKIDIAKYIK